jgi:hypothetical protein
VDDVVATVAAVWLVRVWLVVVLLDAARADAGDCEIVR